LTVNINKKQFWNGLVKFGYGIVKVFELLFLCLIILGIHSITLGYLMIGIIQIFMGITFTVISLVMDKKHILKSRFIQN